MENTGMIKYSMLEEFNLGTGQATGRKKRNDPADPDYVPPKYDPENCPVPPLATISSNKLQVRIAYTGSQFISFSHVEIAPWDKSSSTPAIYNDKCLVLPGQTLDLLAQPQKHVAEWWKINLVSSNFSKKLSLNLIIRYTTVDGVQDLITTTVDINTGKVWDHILLPRTTSGGVNLLEFILADTTIPSVENIPPVANAGADVSVFVEDEPAVQLQGSGTDGDGYIVSWHWDKIVGPVAFQLSDANVAQPIITGLVAGLYKFRLTVTDNRGAIGQDEVSIMVDAREATTNGTLLAYVDSLAQQAFITQIELRPNGDGDMITLLDTPLGSTDGALLKTPPKGTYDMYVTIAGTAGSVKADYQQKAVCQPYQGEGLYIFHDVTIGDGAEGVAVTLSSGSCGDEPVTLIYAKLTITNNTITEQALLPFGKKIVRSANVNVRFYQDAALTQPATANVLLNYRITTTDAVTAGTRVLDTYTQVTNTDSILLTRDRGEAVYDLSLDPEKQLLSDTDITYELLPGVGYKVIS
ncbi:PKD domain-containing protein [Chitinophaga sp. sic0106]|uniref:PKD domain-containing protein n=1 Tax=Chitinophaga sp. sic0106 TaxID=2854785 RepID=UPI001C47C9EF|nr:PKD domain-containing protein [Chitinophaga sp. sic0106]MBV7533768.1 PKD domain-containing protein [Chitinophaga sp. sic0106]